VVKSDKCMGVSHLLGGTCPGFPPKSTPMGPGELLVELFVKWTLEKSFLWLANSVTNICRAHNFPRQNLTNSAANLVNFAALRGKAGEIPRLTADTQLNFRGLIKSW